MINRYTDLTKRIIQQRDARQNQNVQERFPTFITLKVSFSGVSMALQHVLNIHLRVHIGSSWVGWLLRLLRRSGRTPCHCSISLTIPSTQRCSERSNPLRFLGLVAVSEPSA